jgi:hypothetical protein
LTVQATDVTTVAQPTNTDRVAMLQGAAETHRVFRFTDGADEDSASWYADWLLDHSELSELLGARPVRSHLVHALVQLDRDHADRAAGTDEPWPAFYAAASTNSSARRRDRRHMSWRGRSVLTFWRVSQIRRVPEIGRDDPRDRFGGRLGSGQGLAHSV